MVPFTLRDKQIGWLKDGRQVHPPPPLALATSRELGIAAAEEPGAVRTVKDRRLARAARLIRSGRGQVRALTYSHSGGYWWAALRLRVVADAVPQPRRRPGARTSGPVGVDAGMGTRFATQSTVITGVTDEDGVIATPRHLRQVAARLADAQRWLTPTEKGSRRRAKAVARVQRLHGKVVARREGSRRTLAIALVEAHPVIGVEDLNLRGRARRSRGWRFPRSIADNGWASFVTTLEHQAAERGSVVVKADRFPPSSTTCSACGAMKAKLLLAEREYTCTTCELVIDRDVDAAVTLAAVAGHALEQREHDGVGDAGEASGRQTPSRRSAAASGTTRLVERRVPTPTWPTRAQHGGERPGGTRTCDSTERAPALVAREPPRVAVLGGPNAPAAPEELPRSSLREAERSSTAHCLPKGRSTQSRWGWLRQRSRACRPRSVWTARQISTVSSPPAMACSTVRPPSPDTTWSRAQEWAYAGPRVSSRRRQSSVSRTRSRPGVVAGHVGRPRHVR